jgi:hypothetical protein
MRPAPRMSYRKKGVSTPRWFDATNDRTRHDRGRPEFQMSRRVSIEVEGFRQLGHGMETAELAVVPGRQFVDDDIRLRVEKCEKGAEVVAQCVEIQVGHWRSVLAKAGREDVGIVRRRRRYRQATKSSIRTYHEQGWQRSPAPSTRPRQISDWRASGFGRLRLNSRRKAAEAFGRICAGPESGDRFSDKDMRKMQSRERACRYERL